MSRLAFSELALALPLALGVLAAPLAQAGMGALKPLSAQGEPLQAEVALDLPEGAEGGAVRLAARHDYPLLQPYSVNASLLRFEINSDANGRPVVQLAGPALAGTDVLRFAIEYVWPGGRWVREYRLHGYNLPARPQPADADLSSPSLPFIDTPSDPALGRLFRLSKPAQALALKIELLGALASDKARTQAVFSVRGLDAAARTVLNGVRLEVEREDAQHFLLLTSPHPMGRHALSFELDAVFEGAKAGRRYSVLPATAAARPLHYRVVAGDSAFALARRFYPARSPDKAVRALLAANAQAFVAGDANRLRAGALLRLPDISARAAAPSPTVAAKLAPPAPAPAPAAEPVAVTADIEAQVAADKVLAEHKLVQLQQAQARLAALEKEVVRLSALSLPEGSGAVEDASLDEELARWLAGGTGGIAVMSLLAWQLARRNRARLGGRVQTAVQAAPRRPEEPEPDIAAAPESEPDERLQQLQQLALNGERVAFAALAHQVLADSAGQGEEWAAVVRMGQGLDPENALYRMAEPDVAAPEQVAQTDSAELALARLFAEMGERDGAADLARDVRAAD
ncbi:FimV/HubP-related protein [Craterilacuibacter sinensis]|uniref:FimV N-terminal domain-containing protein n=1 Tax=Craterilacuibacter sinensis TaxID=2686017 RepID=A0A845BLP5_9NEIS|nr:hypothetical protein [Craterilacuibacter sinensis]MXR36320.1 hypothetical protein [Craterilacuibacter sinensis]